MRASAARTTALPARKFLYVIAAIILLVFAFGVSWSLFQDRMMRWAFVPSVDFAPLPAATAPDYAKAAGWIARPDLPDDPARFAPAGFAPTAQPQAAVFYVAPTTYLARTQWNAPIDDADANARLALFTRSQASAFNGVGAVWAPRYRQATIGAFLGLTDPRAEKAIDFAYADVLRAFDVFVAAQPADRPIILAGHSQGSLHLLRLLRDRVAGRPLANRIVAVYAVGWPVSIEADLPALGLPACHAPQDQGCILSWQSFAEPADAALLTAYFEASRGYAGRPRKDTQMLCVDPIGGVAGGASPGSANKGALVPHADFAGADVEKGRIRAVCTPEGLLSIGSPPEGFGRYVLPGNNYHVFDYALFWADVRADAARRLAAFRAR